MVKLCKSYTTDLGCAVTRINAMFPINVTIEWAQIYDRNAISWADKFALNVWYVDNRSLWLDLRILWLTVRNVIARDDISAEGEATMTAFTRSTPGQRENLR
jgi:hypothetical protein